MARHLDLRGLPPLYMAAGIISMGCGACDFEFVYVRPEESERAEHVMKEHFEDRHPDLGPVPVHCTSH